MDYEKKYKEALERAREKRDEYKRLDGEESFVPSDIEYIFPELKESEDERIRKGIIEFLSTPFVKKGMGEGALSTWIAWLEKQGERKPIISNNALREGIAYFGITQHQIDNWLKKYIDVEKQGEQKTTDKVEPKFEVGDWIYHEKSGNTIHINRIENCTYISDEGGTISFGRQDDWRNWTIQDAKDGDVLVCESGWTCIFKTLVNDETFSSYCFMDNTKWFCETGSECHTLKEEFVKAYNGKIYPATREQRDLLFVKMKEAGYEWDEEKKELKKIEQSELTEFEEAVKDMIDDYRDAIDAHAATTEEVKGFAAYMLSLIPHKPDWSEEDEKMENLIIKTLASMGTLNLERYHHMNLDEVKKWLKSIKDRVQLQSKQE